MHIDDEAFRRRTGITDADLRVLAATPLFAGLDHETLKRMLQESSIRRYPRATTLFLQGEDANRCFVVFEGWLKLYRDTMDGHESVITVVGPGECFAEAAMFSSAAFPVSCSAIEDTRALVVTSGALFHEMRQNPEVGFNMLASMSARLRGLVRQIEQLTTRSTTQRVADFLVRLADADFGEAEVQLPHDKGLVAGRLGMQPESFSRALSRLRRFGVTTEGRMVKINDLAMLQTINEQGLQ